MSSATPEKKTESFTITITSAAQLRDLISSSIFVVVDFTAVWCGPCKAISPIYEKLSAKLTSPGKVAFAKCDVDDNQEISREYDVRAMPTFIFFKNSKEVTRVQGANVPTLTETIQRLAAEAKAEAEAIKSTGSTSATGGFTAPPAPLSFSSWTGRDLPKGYSDVTDQVEVKGLDLMNAELEYGSARILFDAMPPSRRASSNKGKGKDSSDGPDWIESDTDEQLMLFIPFQSTVKIHSIQFTSFPPAPEDEDDTDTPSRPKTIKIFPNTPNILSFDDALEGTAVQTIELKPENWDVTTGTASVAMRFVKFQNVSSMTIFFEEVERKGAEKVRLDRIRLIGECGEKKEMGKLEKVGDLQGE